jgi:NDP-sugar pyrophosphorylase family protein
MFSLCIPTIDRFDIFLSNYLTKYLENEYIDEIIITDENGNDIEKIKATFPDNNKLKLFKNDSRLGPFLNKIKACSFAKNEWIVLMDSDNFAYKDYFINAKNYIKNMIDNDSKNIILAPSKARPNFDYSHLSGFIYKKGNFNKNNSIEHQIKKSYNSPSSTLMNTGNYVINKYLIDNLNLQSEKDNICKSSACDVIYFNTLLFEQFDLNMHVVSNLEYDHVVHNGSIYTQTYNNNKDFNNYVYKRYNNLV